MSWPLFVALSWFLWSNLTTPGIFPSFSKIQFSPNYFSLKKSLGSLLLAINPKNSNIESCLRSEDSYILLFINSLTTWIFFNQKVWSEILSSDWTVKMVVFLLYGVELKTRFMLKYTLGSHQIEKRTFKIEIRHDKI